MRCKYFGVEIFPEPPVDCRNSNKLNGINSKSDNHKGCLCVGLFLCDKICTHSDRNCRVEVWDISGRDALLTRVFHAS